MNDFATEKCRTCDADIIWTVTDSGKPMPVDAQPTSNGNIALSTNDKGQVVSRVVPAHLAFGRRDLRTSHFVDCVHADQWRRNR